MKMSKLTEFLQLSMKRKDSVDNYFEFQRFQAKLLIKDLENDIHQAKRILDIGSGIGGYIFELSEQFPEKIIISLDKNPLEYAVKKTKNIKNIKTIKGDGTIIPFKDDAFDIVLASSLIEHVTDQEAMINEVRRILKDNGFFYVSFPPFYSPVGGHSISPLHYLPGNMPFYLYSKLYKQKFTSFKNYGLVKTTIKSVKRLVSNKFDILDIKPRIFDFVKPLLKIPVINEVVCHHVEFFLRKKQGNP